MGSSDVVGDARKVLKAMQRSKPKERALPLRVDTDESYEAYIAERAAVSPHIPDLANSVSALQQALSPPPDLGPPLPQINEDGVEVVPADVIDDLAGDVSRLTEAALSGDEPIAVSLPPIAYGKVRCWRDGRYVCCSMRVKGPDGRVRILTTSSPVSEHVDEVVGLAASEGVDAVDALTYLPEMTLRRGAGKLIDRLDEVRSSIEREKRLCDTSRVHRGTINPGGKITWETRAR